VASTWHKRLYGALEADQQVVEANLGGHRIGCGSDLFRHRSPTASGPRAVDRQQAGTQLSGLPLIARSTHRDETPKDSMASAGETVTNGDIGL
jgi:hypothetical protein